MAGMDAETAATLRGLLLDVPVAALATLHKGEPAVSMVPWVWSPDLESFLIHVSGLATHTRDMQEHPRVSAMVMGCLGEAPSPQALPRISLQADARFLDKRDASAYAAQQAVYLARFPDAEIMFGLGDFSLVALQPVSARLVAGFGQAYSLVGERLRAWLLADDGHSESVQTA